MELGRRGEGHRQAAAGERAGRLCAGARLRPSGPAGERDPDDRRRELPGGPQLRRAGPRGHALLPGERGVGRPVLHRARPPEGGLRHREAGEGVLAGPDGGRRGKGDQGGARQRGLDHADLRCGDRAGAQHPVRAQRDLRGAGSRLRLRQPGQPRHPRGFSSGGLRELLIRPAQPAHRGHGVRRRRRHRAGQQDLPLRRHRQHPQQVRRGRGGLCLWRRQRGRRGRCRAARRGLGRRARLRL